MHIATFAMNTLWQRHSLDLSLENTLSLWKFYNGDKDQANNKRPVINRTVCHGPSYRAKLLFQATARSSKLVSPQKYMFEVNFHLRDTDLASSEARSIFKLAGMENLAFFTMLLLPVPLQNS